MYGRHSTRQYPHANYFSLPINETPSNAASTGSTAAGAPSAEPAPAQGGFGQPPAAPGATQPPATAGAASPAAAGPRARVTAPQMPNPTEVSNAKRTDSGSPNVFTTFSPSVAVASAATPMYSADMPYLNAASMGVRSTQTMPQIPPSVLRPNVQFVDNGSAIPRFLRMTYNVLPADSTRASEVALPIAAVLTPLADVPDDSEAVMLVDHGEEGPVRCQRCRAYMTPYTTFTDGGSSFKCALCGRTTEVPTWYFSPVDITGTRADANSRPELTKGSVEYAISNKDYFTNGKTPKKPCICFVIDVSETSMRMNMLPVVIAAIKQALAQGQIQEKVAFLTYDHIVHFWDFSIPHGSSKMPAALFYADTSAMAAPRIPGMFVDYSDAEKKEMVDAFLDNLIPMMQAQHAFDAEQRRVSTDAGATVVTAALGAALQGACLMFKNMELFGRAILFNASFPTAAPGALIPRSSKAEEQDLLKPQTEFYQKLAHVYAESKVGCDLFLFGNTQDVVTLGTMARNTGGQAYTHLNFDAANDSWLVQAQVARNLSRTWGYDAALRVRCSNGLGVQEYDGHISDLSTDVDADIPIITSESTIAVILQHDDKLPEDNCVYVQAALLYTTRNGERRVRVHNAAMRASRDHSSIFKGLDCDAIVGTLARMGAGLIYENNSLPSTTAFLSDTLVTSLATYRSCCCQNPSATQLILPEAIRLLPIYMIAMLKNPLFRHSSPADQRMSMMLEVMHQSLVSTLLHLYPKIFSLKTIMAAAADPEKAAAGAAGAMAVPSRLSSSMIGNDDVFLVDNGTQLLVWIRGNPSPELITACFGAEYTPETLGSFTSPQLSQAFAAQLGSTDPASPFAEIVGVLSMARLHNNFSISVIPPAQSPDRYFMWNTEDEESGVTSYMKYLCLLHRRIHTKISEDDSAAASIAFAHRH